MSTIETETSKSLVNVKSQPKIEKGKSSSSNLDESTSLNEVGEILVEVVKVVAGSFASGLLGLIGDAFDSVINDSQEHEDANKRNNLSKVKNLSVEFKDTDNVKGITNEKNNEILIDDDIPIIDNEKSPNEKYFSGARKNPDTLEEFLKASREFLFDMRNVIDSSSSELLFEKTLVILIEQELKAIESSLVQSGFNGSGGNRGNNRRSGIALPNDENENNDGNHDWMQQLLKAKSQSSVHPDISRLANNLNKYLDESYEIKIIDDTNSHQLEKPWWIRIVNSIEKITSMSVLLIDSLSLKMISTVDSLSSSLVYTSENISKVIDSSIQSTRNKVEEEKNRVTISWKNFWENFLDKSSKFIRNLIKPEIEKAVVDAVSNMPPSEINNNFYAPVASVSMGQSNVIKVDQNIAVKQVSTEGELEQKIEIEKLAIFIPLYEISEVLENEKCKDVRLLLDDLINDFITESEHSRLQRRIKRTINCLWELCKENIETQRVMRDLAISLNEEIPE